MERINLVDMDFNSFDQDEKRLGFITMDLVLKNLHKNNLMVTSFNPRDIYYHPKTTLYSFEKVDKIKPELYGSKDKVILDNIVSLSTLAFCSYLHSYDPKDGLLNNDVIAREFSDFTDIFDKDDIGYYKDILVDRYSTKELPHEIYYTDYLIKRENELANRSNSNNKVMLRATEAFKRMSDDNDNAAFTNQFFLVTAIASMMIGILGIILLIIS